MAAIPHGAPSGPPCRDHGDAGRQVGHGLAEEGVGWWSLPSLEPGCGVRPPPAYASGRASCRCRGGRCAGARRGSPRGRGRRRRSSARAGTGPRAARRRPAASRRSPAWRQSAARVASLGCAGWPRASRRFGRGARRPARPVAASAARRPNTRHSASEFEASRFAPWRPVHAHSPTAYRPGSDERPSRSVATPPIV